MRTLETMSAEAEPDATEAPPEPAHRPRRNPAAAAAAVGAGALVALSLPPWGWWPLAFVGLAILDRLLAGRSRRSRALRAYLFSLAWYLPGMGWMWFLSAPGWVAACAVCSGYIAAAVAIAPNGRWRWLGLPCAITLAEALRFTFPFEGVPLASLPIGQVAGPLAPIVRFGGPLLLTFVTVLVGMALSALWERRPRLAAALVAAPVLLAVAGAVLPLPATVGTVSVAYVQGGGEQGTRAVNTDNRVVVERHLAATRSIQRGPDLVVWPENVVDVPLFLTSPEREEIAAEARRLNAPVLVGITEDTADNRFLNAQVVVLPDGSVSSRYEKVRRVPFGEYMPLRRLLTDLGAPTDLVPRDAVAGSGPAVLDTPVGRFGVVISWEVFFADRARDGVDHGGLAILNPTNGSSYTGSVLQTQQIASSRLRAMENGRWVVQVAPTGFSAFVDPGGHVHDRSSVSEQRVEIRSIELRRGRTPATIIGDWPTVVLAAIGLTVSVVADRRSRRLVAPA